jgi:hypothetical protein
MTEPVALKHRAFISYGHADTTRVNWVHRGLEGFRIDSDLVGRETRSRDRSLRHLSPSSAIAAGHTLTVQTLAALVPRPL